MGITSKLSEEQRKRLSFIEETAIMYNQNSRLEVIHFISKESFGKLEKMFTTSADIDTIKPKMKVYVIGNGTLKMSDIKEICKKRELKITTDISNADIIISNTNTVSMSTTITGWFQNKAILHNIEHSKYSIDYMSDKNRNKLKEWLNGRLLPEPFQTVALEAFENYSSFIMPKHQAGYQDFTYDEYSAKNPFITDDGLALLYQILSRKIPIIMDSDLFESIEKVTIDSDMYEMIKMMLRSTDDDKSIAMQMLYNCNINKSAYYLWKILNEDGHRILYCRNRNTKIHKSFVELTSDIRHITTTSAIDSFHEIGCLTEDIYNEFIDKNKKDILNELRYFDKKLFRISVESLTYNAYLETKEAVNA